MTFYSVLDSVAYKIDFINPEEYPNRNDISIELNPGKYVNIYILRQN